MKMFIFFEKLSRCPHPKILLKITKFKWFYPYLCGQIFFLFTIYSWLFYLTFSENVWKSRIKNNVHVVKKIMSYFFFSIYTWYFDLTCSYIFWKSKIKKSCTNCEKKLIYIGWKSCKYSDFWYVGANLVYQNISNFSLNYNQDFLGNGFSLRRASL